MWISKLSIQVEHRRGSERLRFEQRLGPEEKAARVVVIGVSQRERRPSGVQLLLRLHKRFTRVHDVCPAAQIDALLELRPALYTPPQRAVRVALEEIRRRETRVCNIINYNSQNKF